MCASRVSTIETHMDIALGVAGVVSHLVCWFYDPTLSTLYV